jgi:hypothetical protein
MVAGQQDRCLILPYTAAYVSEGEEPGGAQRLAIPKLAVCIVVYFVALRLASRAPVLLVGVVLSVHIVPLRLALRSPVLPRGVCLTRGLDARCSEGIVCARVGEDRHHCIVVWMLAVRRGLYVRGSERIVTIASRARVGEDRHHCIVVWMLAVRRGLYVRGSERIVIIASRRRSCGWALIPASISALAQGTSTAVPAVGVHQSSAAGVYQARSRVLLPARPYAVLPQACVCWFATSRP